MSNATFLTFGCIMYGLRVLKLRCHNLSRSCSHALCASHELVFITRSLKTCSACNDHSSLQCSPSIRMSRGKEGPGYVVGLISRVGLFVAGPRAVPDSVALHCQCYLFLFHKSLIAYFSPPPSVTICPLLTAVAVCGAELSTL
jgi:hypothetical protein